VAAPASTPTYHLSKGRGNWTLADYEYDGPDGELFGVYLFTHGSQLAGIDVWSIDGRETPTSLPDPDIDELRPFR
jgi:hypothetical protein